MEEMIPIKIKKIIKDNTTLHNQQYYNVHVTDCPPYIQSPTDPYKYIRSRPIKRYQYDEHSEIYSWPEHPKNQRGENKGAIVLIESADGYYLILRNGKLWGLPKGTRSYLEFIRAREKALKDPSLWIEEVRLDNEETAEANIIRETYEETGLLLDINKLEQPEPNDKVKYNRASAYVKFFYKLDITALEYADILLKEGTDHENDEMRWVNLSEMNRLLDRHCDYRQKKIFNHVSYLFLLEMF